MRFIEKPDRSLRLLNKLMALNDMEKEDLYSIFTIREFYSPTQGSKCLKGRFIILRIQEEINIKNHPSSKGKLMRVIAWLEIRKQSYDHERNYG